MCHLQVVMYLYMSKILSFGKSLRNEFHMSFTFSQSTDFRSLHIENGWRQQDEKVELSKRKKNTVGKG